MKTEHTLLDELAEEFKRDFPEEYEKAQKEAKEWARKVKSGEIGLDIKELYFDENGNLREIE